jgi:hypothetical protein
MAGRKLKVFQAQFGFYDTVVAAPSQAAALRAWGVHQNLFSEGHAAISTDAATVRAALKHPGELLRRQVGTEGRFERQPRSEPVADTAPRTAKPDAHSSKPKRAAPDRSPLERAEKQLEALEAARVEEEEQLDKRQTELDDAKREAKARFLEQRKVAKAALAKAGRAFHAAGG